jgi:hypothetical protein
MQELRACRILPGPLFPVLSIRFAARFAPRFRTKISGREADERAGSHDPQDAGARRQTESLGQAFRGECKHDLDGGGEANLGVT